MGSERERETRSLQTISRFQTPAKLNTTSWKEAVFLRLRLIFIFHLMNHRLRMNRWCTVEEAAMALS